MKIIVFGATGSVGRLVVAQALKQGHLVTAFSRNPEKLERRHPNLTLVQGDVMDFAAVEKAIQTQDAVICLLGGGKDLSSKIRSEGTQQIIKAMEQSGVRRLICQSTLGTGETWNNLNFYWKYVMFGFILRNVFADHIRQEHYVEQSHLDWTIIRPSAFIEGPCTGHYKHGFPSDEKSITLKIARADVADFILKQLSTDRYLGKKPSLSY